MISGLAGARTWRMGVAVATWVAAGIGSPAAFAETPVQVQPPNLAGPVAGSLGGSASVNAGAASYSLVIAVPPGTVGVVPELSVNYSSQAGMSTLGQGWSLGGLSAITRCGKTLVQDGVRRAVALDANDQFCLDGRRLLLVSGTHGANAEYRTQLDDFSKVVSTGSDPAKGPDAWTVYAKSGRVSTYGGRADSRVEAQGRTQLLSWALSRSQDRRGNYYDVTYAKNSDRANWSLRAFATQGTTTRGSHRTTPSISSTRRDPTRGKATSPAAC